MASIIVERKDVEAALLRPLTPNEDRFLDALCMQAEAKLRTAMPSLERRLALEDDDPAHVDPVVVSAMLAGVIKRVLVNPKGLFSSTDADGPMSHSETYSGGRGADGALLFGALVITASDLAQLQRPASNLPRTMRLGRPAWCR